VSRPKKSDSGKHAVGLLGKDHYKVKC